MQEGPLLQRAPSDEIPIRKLSVVEINQLLSLLQFKLTPSYATLKMLNDTPLFEDLQAFNALVLPHLNGVDDREYDILAESAAVFEVQCKNSPKQVYFYLTSAALKHGELLNAADARLIGIVTLFLSNLHATLLQRNAAQHSHDHFAQHARNIQTAFLYFMGHLKRHYLQEISAIHTFLSVAKKMANFDNTALRENRLLVVKSLAVPFFKALLLDKKLIPDNETQETLLMCEMFSYFLQLDQLDHEYVNANYPFPNEQMIEQLANIIASFKNFIPTELLNLSKAQQPSLSTLSMSTGRGKNLIDRRVKKQNSFPPPDAGNFPIAPIFYNQRGRSRSVSTSPTFEEGTTKKTTRPKGS